MIVVCPTCHNKYSVQSDAIGESKLVRCAMCSATWRQLAVDESLDNRRHVRELIKWTFFWFVALVLIFSIFFAKSAMLKIWPPIAELYNAFGIGPINNKKSLVIRNVSNFFVQKGGKLYMGLKGELINISDQVQVLPSVTISLQNDDSAEKHERKYKKIWTHDMIYKKLLPNQKIVFETELQSVPYNNLICDIRLDIL